MSETKPMTSRLRLAVPGLVLALQATLIASLPAAAQTLEQCLAGCGDTARACESVGDGREASCVDARSSCVADCQNLPSSGGSRAQRFGAIAYSTSARATGIAYDWGDRAGAEGSALAACRQRAGDAAGCEVVLWFYDACGAIATTADGTWGAGYGARKYLAEGLALQYCRQQGGGGTCIVQQSVCTGL